MSEPIVVAGAGIGGLAAALALSRVGRRVELVERAAEIREVGAGLQVGPNGFRALDRLGIADAVDAICFRPAAIVMRDSVTGEELARQVLGATFEARFGYPYRVAYRADLQAVLLRAVQRSTDVTISLGDGVSGIEQREDQVEVQLDSGRMIRGSALVGADGIRSRTRDHLLGDGAPRVSGHVAYRAVLPVGAVPADVLSDMVQVWVGPRHHLVCYRLRGGALFNIVAIFHSRREVEGWDTTGDAAELGRAFAGACDGVQRLLAMIAGWRMWVLCDRDPDDRWTDGRVTLLGDAAHPMLPFLAQGACMAIEDAVALADRVAAADIPSAFAAYAAARAPRNASVQLAAREAGIAYHADGAARTARNSAMRARAEDDYEANAWLFESDGPRPTVSTIPRPGLFGRP